MNTTACNCGGDSPLSTAANVVGLLTFVLATFISTIGYLQLTSGAAEEIETYTDELKRTNAQLQDFLQFWREIQRNSEDLGVQRCAEGLQDSMSALSRDIEPVARDLKQVRQSPPSRRGWNVFGMYRRIVWIQKRREFAEQMTRIRNMKNELMFSQLDLLLQ